MACVGNSEGRKKIIEVDAPDGHLSKKSKRWCIGHNQKEGGL
jgi:hypothetical protein